MKLLLEDSDSLLSSSNMIATLILQENPISIPIWKNTITVNSTYYLNDELWVKSRDTFYPIIEFAVETLGNRKRIGQEKIKQDFHHDFWKTLRFSHLKKYSGYEIEFNPFGSFRVEYFNQLLSKLVTQTITKETLRMIWYIMTYELT